MRTLDTNMMKIVMQHINVRIMLMNILVIPIQKMIKYKRQKSLISLKGLNTNKTEVFKLMIAKTSVSGSI